MDLQNASLTSFQDLVGQAFRLSGEGFLPIEATLHRVEELPPSFSASQAPPELRSTPFALIFQAPAQPELGQGCYTFEHPEIGKLEGVFIVPIAGNAQFRRYEVVFN